MVILRMVWFGLIVVVVRVELGFTGVEYASDDDGNDTDDDEWYGIDVGNDVKLDPVVVLLITFVITDRPGAGRKIPCCAPGATRADSALSDVIRPAPDPLASDRFFDKLITSLACGKNVG